MVKFSVFTIFISRNKKEKAIQKLIKKFLRSSSSNICCFVFCILIERISILIYRYFLVLLMVEMNGDSIVKDYDTKTKAILEQCRISQKLLNYTEHFNYPYVSEVTYYEQLLKIGQGTFGEVFKARCKRTGRLVALKKILMENEKEGFPITALREIKMLQTLRHQHITELVEVCTSRQKSGRERFCFYLVFTFCEHDLAGLLSNTRVEIRLVDIKTMLQHILRGLHKIHSSQILHRDMKSANVLITGDGVLKLADFGLARLMYKQPEHCYTNRVVTLWYRPAELLLGTRNYGPTIDIWGAGCIMAELWTRTPILQGDTEQEQLNRISRLCGSINPNSWPGCDKLPYYGKLTLQQNLPRRVRERLNPFMQNNEQALSLIDLLLTLNPEKRPSASAALDHNFFFEAPIPAANIQELLQQLKGTNLFEYTAGCGAHANRRRPVAPAAPMHQQHAPAGAHANRHRPVAPAFPMHQQHTSAGLPAKRHRPVAPAFPMHQQHTPASHANRHRPIAPALPMHQQHAPAGAHANRHRPVAPAVPTHQQQSNPFIIGHGHPQQFTAQGQPIRPQKFPQTLRQPPPKF